MSECTPNPMARWPMLLDGLRQLGFRPVEAGKAGEEWLVRDCYRMIVTAEEIWLFAFTGPAARQRGQRWLAYLQGDPAERVILAAVDALIASDADAHADAFLAAIDAWGTPATAAEGKAPR